MAKLKNNSGITQTFTNEPWLAAGVSMVWKPGEEKVIFNEDFNKSATLQTLVANHEFQVIDQTQPGAGGAAPMAGPGFGGV